MYKRIISAAAVGLITGVLGLASSSSAQSGAKLATSPVSDPSKLEGKAVNKVQPDDVRVLGILAFSLINEARGAGKPVPLAQLQLSGLGTKAFNAKDYETAFRYATRFIYQRRGLPLQEATEVASSLDFQLGRKVVAPGEPLAVRLTPVYTLGHPLTATYMARFSLFTAAGKRVQDLKPVTLKNLEPQQIALATSGLAEGRYILNYELFSPGNTSLLRCDRDFYVRRTMGTEVKALADALEKIRGQQAGRAGGSPRQAAALESATYLVDYLQRAQREYLGALTDVAHPIVGKLRGLDGNRTLGEKHELDNDLKLATQLVEGLTRGGDPLRALTGDMHLAYRSALDNTLQPFRVFVPQGYDPARQYPLVVALHGATGDENTYPERYLVPGTQESLFKKLGQQHGFILVSPNGRGPFGGYTGDSEKDVLDVLARVQLLWPIAPRHVFLTGHSMGAMGTWMIGFRHADRFAALAPLAGRPAELQTIGLSKAPQMPVLMYHGTRDTIALIQPARELAKLAEKELKRFKYVETQDDHFGIGVTSMPAIFEFFAKLSKQ